MCLGPPITEEERARQEERWAATPIEVRLECILARFEDPRDRKWFAPRVSGLLRELAERAGVKAK